MNAGPYSCDLNEKHFNSVPLSLVVSHKDKIVKMCRMSALNY